MKLKPMHTDIDTSLAAVLPQAMILINQQQDICWWNDAAEKLFHLDNGFLNQSINRLSPELLSNTQCTSQIQIGPHVRWLSHRIIPYSDNLAFVMVEDITHIRKLEHMRQDFVANVSHELRTPLTVIHGYLELFLETEDFKKNPFDNILTQMHQQSCRMQRLVEDLLMLSRLETAERASDESSIYLNALLSSLKDEAVNISGERAHQFSLEIKGDHYLKGNSDEIASLFSNLIFNAIKYTPPKGEIKIRWENKDNIGKFSVEDTGIGIEAQHIPRLTERFYRVDKGRSRNSGGTGLGLAIAKHVAIRHEADIDIKSELNKGSIFSCLFPASRLEKIK